MASEASRRGFAARVFRALMISKRLSEKLISSSRYSASILSASLTLSSKRAVVVHHTESMNPSVTAKRLVMMILRE
jgi:hypothetical protein